MPDERTPHLNLPLPHADNLLEDDVLRLREALALVDGSAAQTAADLAAQRETSAAQQAALAGVQARAADLETRASTQQQAQAATAAALTAHEAAENPHHIPTATTARLGVVRIGDGINVDENGIISIEPAAINPWDIFPLRVPIAVDGVTFGGSDGRRAIMPGETAARENWIMCDGGTDGKGGTVPDLRGRMILGASSSYSAGSTGGAATHSHTLSGTVGATTLTVDQIAAHTHSFTYCPNNGSGGGRPLGQGDTWNTATFTTNSAGGSRSHTHSLPATNFSGDNLPPYYALNYIMRIF